MPCCCVLQTAGVWLHRGQRQGRLAIGCGARPAPPARLSRRYALAARLKGKKLASFAGSDLFLRLEAAHRERLVTMRVELEQSVGRARVEVRGEGRERPGKGREGRGG